MAERMLRREVVKDRLAQIGDTKLDDMVKNGELPRATPISGGVKGWPESVIEEFIQACIAADRKPQP